MDTQHYRNFLAVVESGSITAATDYVHIVQPALSKQIRALEAYFGTKLIITRRGSKKIILTDAGEILYQKAKYICYLEDKTQSEIEQLINGDQGTLRFSMANSRAEAFICRCLKPFRTLFPKVNFEIYEGSVKEQQEQLMNGITEIGVFSVPIQTDDLEVLFCQPESMVAVFNHNSHFLAGYEQGVPLNSLPTLPIATSAGCYMQLKKLFLERNLDPNIVSLCTTRRSVLTWVKDDTAVGVVPLGDTEKLSPFYRSVPVLDAPVSLSKTLVKVKGRPLSAIAKKFLEFYKHLDDARHAASSATA